MTDSPTLDSGYAEAAPRPGTEEEEDQRALRAASLRALSPSPEFQSVGSTPSPEQTIEADTQPEFGEGYMIGTSSPAGDDNVYAFQLLPCPMCWRGRRVLEHQQEFCPQSTNHSCELAQNERSRIWTWIWIPVQNCPSFRKWLALVQDAVTWERTSINGTIYPHQGVRIDACPVTSLGEMKPW